MGEGEEMMLRGEFLVKNDWRGVFGKKRPEGGQLRTVITSYNIYSHT
jgi:hypothetical protein